jgi:hypothetical protein
MDLEEQVKVYKLSAVGIPLYHVGYLARRLFKQQSAKSLDLTFLRAKEDLRLSMNAHERGRSNRMLGIVVCKVIRNNTNYNGHNPFKNDNCEVSVSMEPNPEAIIECNNQWLLDDIEIITFPTNNKTTKPRAKKITTKMATQSKKAAQTKKLQQKQTIKPINKRFLPVQLPIHFLH